MTMAMAFSKRPQPVIGASSQTKSAHLESAYERFPLGDRIRRDAIVSTDDHAAITFWNRGAAIIFGNDGAPPAGGSRIVAAGSATLSQRSRRSPAAKAASRATSRWRDAPRHQHVSNRAVALTRAEGRTHVTAIVRDITERRRAQETLMQRDERSRRRE
jgi:PAS domain S-box-containing protein